MTELPWKRHRTIWPVRFTHAADGYMRGLPGSVKDRATPRRSGWFDLVMRCTEGLAFHRVAYRPLPTPQESAA